ncbi:MAG: hypothetical protein PWP31_1415 [Clostridia bacterium]|nr:hypothetical protein [Clostridia bacterium]
MAFEAMSKGTPSEGAGLEYRNETWGRTLC